MVCSHFRCYNGFSGANCSIASCLSVNNCSAHGVCIEADLCKCDVGYTGPDCANVSCEAVNYCSGKLLFNFQFYHYNGLRTIFQSLYDGAAFSNILLTSGKVQSFKINGERCDNCPGGVLPYISYIGMCRPKGYGF